MASAVPAAYPPWARCAVVSHTTTTQTPAVDRARASGAVSFLLGLWDRYRHTNRTPASCRAVTLGRPIAYSMPSGDAKTHHQGHVVVTGGQEVPPFGEARHLAVEG